MLDSWLCFTVVASHDTGTHQVFMKYTNNGKGNTCGIQHRTQCVEDGFDFQFLPYRANNLHSKMILWRHHEADSPFIYTSWYPLISWKLRINWIICIEHVKVIAYDLTSNFLSTSTFLSCGLIYYWNSTNKKNTIGITEMKLTFELCLMSYSWHSNPTWLASQKLSGI